VVQTIVVAADSSDVIGLTGMRLRVVTRKEDAMSLEIPESGINCNFIIVLSDVSQLAHPSFRSSSCPELTWFSSQMVMKRSKALPGTMATTPITEQASATSSTSKRCMVPW